MDCSLCGLEVRSEDRFGRYSRHTECEKWRRRNAYHENPEPQKKRSHATRKKNREAIRAYLRDYYQRNKERLGEQNRLWYQANKEQHREQGKRWRKENWGRDRQLAAEHQQRRRARAAGLPHTLTEAEWLDALQVFECRCAYCGGDGSLEKDHFISLAEGGGYTVGNIIPACRSCNSSKQRADFADWYPQQAFYSPERRDGIIEYLRSRN